MIEVSELQRDNAISAKEMWLTIPEANVAVELDSWRQQIYKLDQDGNETCNTIACFGGWCAVHPAFIAQGIRASGASGAPFYATGNPFTDSLSVSKGLFGSRLLFAARGEHSSDRETKNNDSEAYAALSDWEVVMNRLDWLLRNSVVASE